MSSKKNKQRRERRTERKLENKKIMKLFRKKIDADQPANLSQCVYEIAKRLNVFENLELNSLGHDILCLHPSTNLAILDPYLREYYNYLQDKTVASLSLQEMRERKILDYHFKAMNVIESNNSFLKIRHQLKVENNCLAFINKDYSLVKFLEELMNNKRM